MKQITAVSVITGVAISLWAVSKFVQFVQKTVDEAVNEAILSGIFETEDWQDGTYVWNVTRRPHW